MNKKILLFLFTILFCSPQTLSAEETQKLYYPTGELQSELPVDGTGIIKTYYKNGNLESEMEIQDNVAVGLNVTYYESGELKAEGKFDKGSFNGTMKTYHKNGNLKGEIVYKDGKIDGVAKEYYEDGKLLSESRSIDEENMIAKEFYPTGELKSESTFNNLKLSGVTKAYYKSGKLQSEENYKGDMPHGTAKFYFENGELASIHEYDMGKLLKVKQYDESGKDLPVSIPNNIEDTVEAMADSLSDPMKGFIKDSSEEAIVQNKELRDWTANSFMLWSKPENNLVRYFKAKQVYTPEDMVGIMLVSYKRKIEDKPINLAEQINFYKGDSENYSNTITIDFKLVCESKADDCEQVRLPKDNEEIFVKKEASISIDDVKSAAIESYQYPYSLDHLDHLVLEVQPATYYVRIYFTEVGGKKFAELTQNNINRRLAVFVDGEAVMAPNILEPITGGEAQISGDFSPERFRGMAWRINKLQQEKNKK